MLENQHDLFLLMAGLSQLDDKKLVVDYFNQAAGKLFNTTLTFSYEAQTGAYPVQTKNATFGYIKPARALEKQARANLQNAVQVLAVFMERLHQNELLQNENKRLEHLVNQKTAHLAASQETFRAISENLPDILLRLDEQHRFLFVNQQIEHFTGLPARNFTGRSFTAENLPLQNADALVILVNEVHNSGKGQTITTTHSHQEKHVYLQWRFFPEFGKDGSITGILGHARDITRERAYENELIKAKQRAEHADKLKSAFLSNMSHEIRTPLNAIVGFSDLLTQKQLPAGQKEGYVQIIQENSNQLLKAIDEVLDMARIESGEVLLTKETFQLKHFVFELITETQELIKHRGADLDFTTDIPEQLKETYITTDRRRLKQALNNILENAIKFTRHGKIHVQCRKDENTLQFKVTDTGIGIPSAKQSVIFERFRQGNEALTRDYGGNGLGLSIARGFIDLLNGSISVNSKEGEGSIFIIQLPVKFGR